MNISDFDPKKVPDLRVSNSGSLIGRALAGSYTAGVLQATSANDEITLDEKSNGKTLRLGDGNDWVRASSSLTEAAKIFGQGGNDVLVAERGSKTYFHGGSGSDHLFVREDITELTLDADGRGFTSESGLAIRFNSVETFSFMDGTSDVYSLSEMISHFRDENQVRN